MQLAVAASLFAGAILVADLAVPLGVAGGVPYVAVVLLSLWSPRADDVLLASIGTIGLTVLGWVLSPEPVTGTPAWAIASNRALAIFAISITGGGCYLWQRSRAEVAAIREDLFESERLRQESESLARLGKMSALIAHEVKNPLAGMRAALQVLGRSMPEQSNEHRVMGEICDRVDALHTTLENMLVYGRPDAARPQTLAIRAILEAAIAQLREDPSHDGVQIELIQDAEVTLTADPRRCSAAVFNLLLNASQAMSGEGAIRIQTTLKGTWCVMTMQDDGPGMSQELLQTIFDPFVTTKARGSGLGLAIVRQTVTQHGGEIEVTSEVGVGTCVTLSLPGAQAFRG